VIAGSAYVASALSASHGREFVALAVAILSGVQAIAKPNEMALKYRRAWIELDDAIMRATGMPSALLDAMRGGEQHIEETYAQAESAARRPPKRRPQNSN
jgi:hypothetical protein